MALLSGGTFENEFINLIKFYMKKKTTLNKETPPAAKPLLPAVYLIGVVGIDLFPQRMHLDKEIGDHYTKNRTKVFEFKI